MNAFPFPPAIDAARREATMLRNSGDAIASTLRLASALVERGRLIDLAGLDDEIGRVCAQVLDLPSEHSLSLRPDLLRLREAVDGLSQALSNALENQAP